MSELPRVKVKEVCSLIIDCVNKTAPIVDRETQYRMIRTTNVRNGRIDLSTCRFVEKDTFDKWTRRASVIDGDVILTREAPIGEVGYVKDLGEVFLGQRIMQYRADKSKIDPRFLFYAFRSPELQHQFGTHEGSGSVVSHIRVADCHEFLVPFAPRNQQIAIGELLGALDDKIDLNRRMNGTLEQTARALFQDWFVDFGPTRAKMAGQAAYLGGDLWGDLWDLFPARLDEAGVPEGWTYSSVGQLANVTKGRSYKSSELQPSDAALVTLKSFSRGGGYREGGLKPYSGSFKLEQVVELGEIVMAQTDVTQAADIIGRPALIGSNESFKTLVASLDVAIIRPKVSEALTKEFLFHVLGSSRFTEHALAHVTGTTVLHLAKNAIPSFQVLLPDESMVQMFTENVSALTKLVHKNAEESRTLAQTRDLLLPKLMSGELRICDAEALVAEQV